MPTTPREPLQVPVSAGELVDKKTILEIKRERMTDPAKRANVEHELGLLTTIAQQAFENIGDAAALRELEQALKQINGAIWDLENQVRVHERNGTFGEAFIATARTTYATNDRRAAVKRQINELLRSDIVEEKSHT
jgi:hypothetical protein